MVNYDFYHFCRKCGVKKPKQRFCPDCGLILAFKGRQRNRNKDDYIRY